MSYVIEDHIPLPPSRRGDAGSRPGPRTALTQTLSAMQPNQSVLLETPEEYSKAYRYIDRMHDRKYATRKIERQGWRVWRLE